jgi:hypothetical protein
VTKETQALIEAAKLHRFTLAEKEEHRRSFAYGNTKIENSRITRELIDREADKLSSASSLKENQRLKQS